MRNRLHLIRAATVAGVLACGWSFADVTGGRVATQIPSGGTFVDSTGTRHAWSISPANALLWDSKPYMPVGGNFYSASLTIEGEASWDRDVTALNVLKAKGITDIIVEPAGSLIDTTPKRLQRLLEFLDKNDFKYGIGFGKGIPNPLTGTVVKPASYKGYPDQSLTSSWRTPNADSAIVVSVESVTGHNEISTTSETKITDNNLTLAVEAPVTAGKVIPYLYPHKSVPSGTRGSIPDMWTGYDTYRDRLLSLFSALKPGKGLRFFLDPLGSELSLADETDYLVPDSSGFLLEWESYIRTRYPNIDEANRSWAIEDSATLSPRQLARLIPLWANDVATPYLYNPANHKTLRITDTGQCQWWSDFLACRNNSIEYYMSGLADILKRQIADVPVVYSCTMNHRIFINKSQHGGFDGLGVSASIRGDRLVNRLALSAYSDIMQSARHMWCIETASDSDADMRPSDGAAGPIIPFSSQTMVSGEITELHRAGVKAFFPGAFHADEVGQHNDWLSVPRSLDWLHESATAMQTNVRAADFVPAVLKYPIAAPGPAIIGSIGTTGVSWVPTFETGTFIDWWPAYTGYTLNDGSDKLQQTVLVSLQGKRKEMAQFVVEDPKTVSARTVNGIPVPVKVIGKNKISVYFADRNPIIFTTNGQQIMPIDAATDALDQLNGLYRYAGILKVPDYDGAKVVVTEANIEYQKQNYPLVNSSARSGIDRLLADTAPYIWIEAESAIHDPNGVSTFDDAPNLPGAASNQYLRLSNYNSPPREYGVHFPFNVVVKGKYNIWIAATPPAGDVSPIQWTWADNQRRDPADPNPHGSLYANDKFGWILLGSVQFKEAGPSKLAIYVTGRAAATGRYSFGIDSVFISTSSEPPWGRNMPLPIDVSSLPKQSGKH